jgi:hypothetical protein
MRIRTRSIIVIEMEQPNDIGLQAIDPKIEDRLSSAGLVPARFVLHDDGAPVSQDAKLGKRARGFWERTAQGVY